MYQTGDYEFVDKRIQNRIRIDKVYNDPENK